MKEFKLLMVDDEEDFVTTLAERMKMRNLSPDIALDGEQALQAVQDMPGRNGLGPENAGESTAWRCCVEPEAYPLVQVIVLTGHGSQQDEQEASRLGAFAYLQKPVEMEKLVRTMRAVYMKNIEDTMAAAAFAEEGDFSTARKYWRTKRTDSPREAEDGKRILVDDEQDFVHILAERLERRGFHVRKAFNGNEAIAMLREKKPTSLPRRAHAAQGRFADAHGNQEAQSAHRGDNVDRPPDHRERYRRVANWGLRLSVQAHRYRRPYRKDRTRR